MLQALSFIIICIAKPDYIPIYEHDQCVIEQDQVHRTVVTLAQREMHISQSCYQGSLMIIKKLLNVPSFHCTAQELHQRWAAWIPSCPDPCFGIDTKCQQVKGIESELQSPRKLLERSMVCRSSPSMKQKQIRQSRKHEPITRTENLFQGFQQFDQ